MKKILLKPGYEFIFTLSIFAILGLPPLVFAQGTKDVDINISNGDTTVNGKNIKDLSPKDRSSALKDIANISSAPKIIADGPPDRPPVVADGDMGGKPKNMRFRYRNGGKDSTFAFNYRISRDAGDKHKMEMDEWHSKNMGDNPMKEFGHKNTQTFSYSTTDSQGISTHVIFHISEPSGAVNHGLGDDGNPQFDVLDLKDLTLVPEFEAGKTIISFSLPSKAPAEVQFKDSQNNVIWSERVINGDFSKAFSLGLNGVYYLHVKQGSKLAVKKILKD